MTWSYRARVLAGAKGIRCRNAHLLGVLPLLAATAGVAYAQGEQGSTSPTAPAADDAISEVVVTAQFRSESLEKTPVAITALSGAALEARGADTIANVENAAPNVAIKPAGSSGGPAANVYIRGIGQSDTSFAFEPGVGMYVDDVYHGVLYGSLFDLFDLDRVEVLRGPQGTLAGKNSIGGAVKLYTRKPDGLEDGYLEVGTGSFSRVNLKGAGDFVLVPDTLFVRVSGLAEKSDGYLADYDYSCQHPGSSVPGSAPATNCVLSHEGGQDTDAARLAVRWKASERLEINFGADILSDDSEVQASKLISLTAAFGLPPGINKAAFTTGPTSYSNYATFANPAFSDPASYAGATGAGAHPATAFGPVNHLRTYDVNANIDWQVADAVKLTSITAYQQYTGAYSVDVDLTPYAVNTNYNTFFTRQFTQELRLAGTLDSPRIDWTLGGFYYDSRSVYGGTQLIAPGTVAENLFVINDRIPSTSKSAFVHAVWHVSDDLSLIGGVRYTQDNKEYDFARLDPYDTALPAYTTSGKLNGTAGTYTGSHTDYRAVAQYQWTGDIMTYAQFSTGYRGGGVNPRPYVAEQEVSFAPETVDAYELGSKLLFLDRRVQLNLAGFFNRYHDIIFINTTPTPSSVLNATPVNAGDANISGVEGELQLRPVRNLQIDASASWLDFRFTRIGAAGATLSGVSLETQEPYAPRHKYSVGTQYLLDCGNLGSLTPRLDVSYQSSFYTNINNNPLGVVGGYTLLNGNVTWNSAKDAWRVSVAAMNLTNKFYYLNKVQFPIGVVDGTPAPPREFLVTLRRTF